MNADIFLKFVEIKMLSILGTFEKYPGVDFYLWLPQTSVSKKKYSQIKKFN